MSSNVCIQIVFLTFSGFTKKFFSNLWGSVIFRLKLKYKRRTSSFCVNRNRPLMLTEMTRQINFPLLTFQNFRERYHKCWTRNKSYVLAKERYALNLIIPADCFEEQNFIETASETSSVPIDSGRLRINALLVVHLEKTTYFDIEF